MVKSAETLKAFAYIRQVLGAVSEFEKAMVVAKLKGARDRKRKTGVKVERRKSVSEMRPEVVELARKLARARPKGGTRSLREIAAELAAAGHVTGNGTPYTATSVSRMLAADPQPARFKASKDRSACNQKTVSPVSVG